MRARGGEILARTLTVYNMKRKPSFRRGILRATVLLRTVRFGSHSLYRDANMTTREVEIKLQESHLTKNDLLLFNESQFTAKGGILSTYVTIPCPIGQKLSR